MKSKFTWIFTLLLAFFIQFSFAQEKQVKTVTGVVNDTQGLPIPGVLVKVQGSTAGAVQTDFDGRYSISAAQGQTLVFSYIGMTEQTAVVGASGTIPAVKLTEGVELTGIVVEAYRTTSKERTNIASATVTSKTIENRPNASFLQTLQGQVPGLNISTGSGQPGSNNTTVLLRGAGSINGNTDPLFVIDGVPQTSQNFTSINPAEIESVSVLKDAGATSIYGNRGANGVIIVKTKRAGYNSKLQIKYSGVTSYSVMQDNKYDMMSSSQLLNFQKAYNGAGRGVNMTDAEIAAAPNYDWRDYFFRTGVSQNHTISLTNGSKNMSSFTSLGYLDQEGILLGTNLKRFNFRSNVNGKSDDDRFNYSTSITANYSQSSSASNLGTGAINQNFVIGAVQGVPYLTPGDYTSGAELASKAANLENTPLYLYDKLRNFTNINDQTKLIGQAQASYKITDDLTVGSTFGVDYNNIITLGSQHPNGFNAIYFAAQDGAEFGGDQSESYSRTVSFNTNTNLTYSKTFGEKHTIEASVFTEYFKAHGKSFGYSQQGLDPIFFSPGTSNGFIAYQSGNSFYVPGDSSGKAEAGLFSYFGSADYDYDGKYGLTGVIRRDASFRFADSNKWGTFWSLAGRWNIDKEKFMEGSIFDMLKLRGSYGTAGNQDITGGGTFSGAALTRFQYGINSGYNNNPAYTITALANPNLKWETVRQADIGLDFSLLKGRVRGAFDVYEKKTVDLFQSLPLSAVNATTSLSSNFGSMRNRGIEAQVSYDVIKSNDFILTVNFNGSYNKNELLELPNDSGIVWDGSSAVANGEGHMLGEYYLAKYAGVNPANGNYLFYDKDGNVTETPTDADRRFTGKSSIPRYQGGFGLDANYKGFFVSTMFTYVADIWRIDWDYYNLIDPDDSNLFNKSKNLLNYWTPDNRNTNVAALYATNRSLDNRSDRILTDASYVRLRYASLGYSFTPELLKSTPFSGIRAYVQGENLFTWTKWKGFDAESNRGADQSQYPTPRMFSLGLEVQF